MTKVLNLILFALTFTSFTIAQIITFDRSLPFGGGKCVKQTSDSGYIIVASNFSIVKVDQNGYIQWSKELTTNHTYSISSVIQTNDGGYAAVCTITKNQPYDQNMYLIKLNYAGQIEWTKEFGASSSREYGYSIIQTLDNGYLVAGSYISQYIYYKPIIYRTDINGNILSVSLINYFQWSPSINLVESTDSTYLFTFDQSLFKIDSYGTEIWHKQFSGKLKQAIYIETSKIALLNSDKLMILSSDGKIERQFELPVKEAYSLTKNSEGDILVTANIDNSGNFNIIFLDTLGQIKSQIPIWAFGYYIHATNDGGFIVTGLNKPIFSKSSLWLYKSNSDGNFSSLNIISPIDSSILQSFDVCTIEWHAQDVDFVDIQYSMDGGSSWNNVINYYPAQLGSIGWPIPEYNSSDVIINIRDTYNREIYDRSDPPLKISTYRSNDFIAANEIFMWIGNNGMGSHDPRTDGSGFYWPGGEEATIPAIFADGLVWGGKVNGEIRVNGSTYRYGLTPGYIMDSGFPSDPFEIKSKIFKLKKNWQYLPPGAERDRYEFDFLNWPVDVGAPWEDNDRDGVYTLGIDNPKILGDETLFFVANDLDTLTSLHAYGSNPIGLEFQVTTFGYNNELLKDVVFKKYKVINKSPNTISDMYLTYWTDDDLGDANDDFVGCDTLLNLGYTYNGDNNDYGYYGTLPPAVAHLIVQPPIFPSGLIDSARFGNGWKKGYKNLPINSFLLFIGGSATFSDPDLGDYSGTLQLYNYMQGLLWDGSPIINPHTNLPTHFCLAGDPVAGIGWYEGTGWPGGPNPADRRFLVTAGKFNMAPSDTQEVTIAILIKKGTDRINSITEIKNYASLIQNWYDNDFVVDVEDVAQILPLEFSLSQNYPNPFNPSTKISWQSPIGSWQTLKIYDVLGNKIATLVDEYKPAGDYEFTFNASELSSGVYFYQLKAESFFATKKMIFIK